jgi:antitoxin HigA-1
MPLYVTEEEFLIPLELSLAEVARAIHVPEAELHAIVENQATMTPRIALRLEKLLGMSVDFWLNLQSRWDLYHVLKAEQNDLAAIVPLERAA